MISALLCESSAPVGSSASRISGRLTSARAIATRCCWPPESCVGRLCSRPVSPTEASARMRQAVRIRRIFVFVKQREFHIFQRVHAGKQVEVLKNEADLLVADFSELVAIEAFHGNASEQIASRGRPVQAAQKIHERGFARTGLSHDRYERAALDGDSDALEGIHGDVSELIRLREVSDVNERCWHSRFSLETRPAARTAGAGDGVAAFGAVCSL